MPFYYAQLDSPVKISNFTVDFYTVCPVIHHFIYHKWPTIQKWVSRLICSGWNIADNASKGYYQWYWDLTWHGRLSQFYIYSMSFRYQITCKLNLFCMFRQTLGFLLCQIVSHYATPASLSHWHLSSFQLVYTSIWYCYMGLT